MSYYIKQIKKNDCGYTSIKMYLASLSKNKDFLDHVQLPSEQILHDFGAILKTTGLVHDIGNPPFGHFGETSIQTYFKHLFQDLKNEICAVECVKCANFTHPILHGLATDINNEEKENIINEINDFLNSDEALDFTQFDGNAQGFRILTKLQYINDLYGMNLTYASLASSLKYPNSKSKNADKKLYKISLHKHGVF